MIKITSEHMLILQLLRHNPRKSFLKISRITGIPVDRVYEIYYELKNNNFIKTITILDMNKSINVLLIFTPETNSNKIFDCLKNNVYVNSISLTDREFIIYASFTNISEYNLFYDMLECLGVDEINEYILKEVIL